MEVPFSPDVEAELQQVAASYGKTAAEFVRQAMSNTLERRAQFLAAVDRGIASADRGELIEHEEAMQRLDALFRS
jgi:predicted transcriptional regulator